MKAEASLGSVVGAAVKVSSIIEELGYAATASASVLKQLLQRIGRPAGELQDEEIANVLLMMIRTRESIGNSNETRGMASSLFDEIGASQSTDLRSWDISVFASVVAEGRSESDLAEIFRKCDSAEMKISSPDDLDVLVQFHLHFTQEPSEFPIESFVVPWDHPAAQLSVLKTAILHKPDVFSLRTTLHYAIPPTETLNASAPSQNVPANCIDLIEALLRTSDANLEDVKTIFDNFVQHCPEYFILSLCQITIPWSNLAKEYASNLTMMFLNGHPQSSFVLPHLWNANKQLAISGILHLYNQDPSQISRILDVAQEMRALSQILKLQPYSFTIDLAALASRREFLNLEKWLQDHLIEGGDQFANSCLSFLREKVGLSQRADAGKGRMVPLSLDVLATFLRVLHANTAKLNSLQAEELKSVTSMSLHAHPRLLNAASLEDSSRIASSFAEDVEEEANSYYEKIYKGELTIEQIVELLQRFRTAAEQRDQDIYKCMVRNLFDEYKFFSRYPEKELGTTSVLFGALIQHQIVTSRALGVALRYVLDALRQPIGSRLFKFGAKALMQFQNRLGEWPQYCALLLQIDHLRQELPDLVQFIHSRQRAAEEQQHATSEHLSTEASLVLTAGQLPDPIEHAVAAVEAPIFTALRLDTLLDAASQGAVELPSESVQDRILFIVNNVSFANLEQKVTEMKELLKESYYRWFSHYIVVKRASIEPNFHTLYVAFLNALSRRNLYKNILHETYLNIRILINSDKTLTSSQERSLLKNLGTWLGTITLGKDKPIKHKNLSIKDLLLEGYDSGRLIAVIPFVCKVLEQCTSSKVFRPPNPWLMSNLRVLAELYNFADLKLNLKFEIEVLCKNIKLDVKDLTPTKILHNRPAKTTVAPPIDATSVDLTAKGSMQPSASQELSDSSRMYQSQQMATSQMGESLTGAGANLSTQTGSVFNVDPQDLGPDVGISLPNLSAYITFNPSFSIFNSQPSLKRIVHIAIDRAVREIIGPVVTRSVTIAGIATRELILKDFALEPDEAKMRKSAHLMISNLAGCLASVSSREPLRVAMMTHLRTLLVQNGFTEQTMPEQAVYMIVADNLDLTCSVLQKAAADKSIPDIDDALAPAYVSRRKHRERSTQPFYDMAVYAASRYPSTLPESLRLKIGGLSVAQMRVYEEFARVQQASYIDAADKPRTYNGLRAEMAGDLTIQPHDGLAHARQLSVDSSFVGTQHCLDKAKEWQASVEKLKTDEAETSQADLFVNDDVQQLLGDIDGFLIQLSGREDLKLVLAQKVVQIMYNDEDRSTQQVFASILAKICEGSKKTSSEIREWLLYQEDDRKYRAIPILSFLTFKIIEPSVLDMQLARLIECGQTNVLKFTITLLSKLLEVETSVVLRSDFLNSFEMLDKMLQQGRLSESDAQNFEEMKKNIPYVSVRHLMAKDADSHKVRSHLVSIFRDWMTVFYHPASNEKSHAVFIQQQIQQQGILRAEAISPLFFRICTEICVESYMNEKRTHGGFPAQPLQAADAFARLIVLLVRFHVDPSGVDNNHARLNLTAKILSIIVLVLVHAHEQQQAQFNQKPFFRLFSTLLNDLHIFENSLQPIYIQILSAVSNTFHTLQPSFLPGFTFSWVQLVSHRYFMPKLLLAESQKFWPFFQRLLVDLFKFLGPLLAHPTLPDTVRALYRSTLRLLLVLLHDFPEFLCDYHFSFVDFIPHNCVQLRNLILSAFPRNMRLPDPFTPNLKVDLLPEINQPPHVLSDYTSTLIPNNVKADVDQYLKTRGPNSFLQELPSRLVKSVDEATGEKSYNTSLMNALVLHVGVQAIGPTSSKPSQGPLPITHTAHMDIFLQLASDLDTNGRYAFFNAIANQLRYPNSHTHFFSCTLLFLFAESSEEIVQEQITRVLIERLVVNRPHPYGLLITFIELIRNPRYNFWEHTNFIRCAPEIERLFTSVAKSINQSLQRSPPQ
ncbi:CCR4-Not complex component, Not1-domain-containing protein [Phlyctochytrium arcticum]|nr:CCR4-Not complex component, Not1-domain-containing protein [Phlyctochytrium arcticum]